MNGFPSITSPLATLGPGSSFQSSPSSAAFAGGPTSLSSGDLIVGGKSKFSEAIQAGALIVVTGIVAWIALRK